MKITMQFLFLYFYAVFYLQTKTIKKKSVSRDSILNFYDFPLHIFMIFFSFFFFLLLLDLEIILNNSLIYCFGRIEFLLIHLKTTYYQPKITEKTRTHKKCKINKQWVVQ